jgi:hypothetical protein
MIPVEGFGFEVSVSAGAELRGKATAERAARALDWLADALGVRPVLRLCVADESDWEVVAPVPMYGMPQTWGDLVVIPAGPSPLVDEQYAAFAPYVTARTTAGVRAAYGDPPDLAGFFDLLLVHELTHLFHEQCWREQPELWLLELHADLGLFGYLAEQEPDQLAGVRAFAGCARDVPAEVVPVRGLGQMELALDDGGAVNFSWYQLRLIALADELWSAGGSGLFRRMHDQFADRRAGSVSLEELAAIDPVLAVAAEGWS